MSDDKNTPDLYKAWYEANKQIARAKQVYESAVQQANKIQQQIATEEANNVK